MLLQIWKEKNNVPRFSMCQIEMLDQKLSLQWININTFDPGSLEAS